MMDNRTRYALARLAALMSRWDDSYLVFLLGIIRRHRSYVDGNLGYIVNSFILHDLGNPMVRNDILNRLADAESHRCVGSRAVVVEYFGLQDFTAAEIRALIRSGGALAPHLT